MVATKDLNTVELEKLPMVGRRPINEKEEKYLKEIGEYEFYNLEEPGLSLKFSYGDTRRKYNFQFFHGGKYKIPRHVAMHLESRCTPIWQWRPDGTGSMNKQQVGTKPRFQMRAIYS